MKKLIWLVFALPFMACSPDVTDLTQATPTPVPAIQTASPSPDTGGAAVMKSCIAYDANNQKLGYVMSSYSSQITLFSTNAYYYTISWTGVITGTVFYTEVDGGGTPFTIIYGYGKTILANGSTLFAPKNLDVYGNSLADTSITTAYSYVSTSATGTTLTNCPSGMNYSTLECIPLKTITRTDAGIPDTIALPIRLSFE